MWRFGTNYSYMWRICTNFSYVIVWRIGTNSSHMRIIGTISSDVRRMLSIHHISEEYFTHGRNQCRYIAHVKISLVVCIYQLWFSCEWLESNAFLGRVGREGDQGINVRNYMTCKFSLARKKKKRYEIRDVLVPILHALWGLGISSSRRKIIWFNKARAKWQCNSESSGEPMHQHNLVRAFKFW